VSAVSWDTPPSLTHAHTHSSTNAAERLGAFLPGAIQSLAAAPDTTADDLVSGVRWGVGRLDLQT